MDPQLLKTMNEKILAFCTPVDAFELAFLVDSDLKKTEFSAKDRQQELQELSDAKDWGFIEFEKTTKKTKDGETLIKKYLGGFIEMHLNKPTGNVFVI